MVVSMEIEPRQSVLPMAPNYPRTGPPDEAWQITCHEAGHAVAAVFLEVMFECVERGDGDFGQVPVGVGPLDNPLRSWTEDEVSCWQRFYAAGAAAEKLLFAAYRPYACRVDQSLHNKLEKLRSTQRNDGWEQDVEAAVAILDQQSIEKVACELDHERKLTAEQVYEILGCVPPWY
jgi:hypothetical protein